MPLSGTFLADFSSFQEACAKSVTALDGFETNASKVADRLDTVTNALQGVKIVQQATIAAQAVDDIGGISRLTEAELAKLGRTAQEAADKLVAMGRDVPPGIQAIADASKAAAAGGDDLGRSWILRIAEGELLRDAVREVLDVVKEMVVYLPELALKGAVVGDVDKSFEHMASSAGLAADVLLGTLRAGTHNTIDDFVLMQRANKDMAAGLDLTTAQYGTMAEGAFALAKATGGDTAEAMDKLSDAMVTGRTKGVALLVGKLDLKAAEEEYAEKLGGTAKQLPPEMKLEADRDAILARVADRLSKLGAQQDSLKDKVDQGHAAWANFEDDLGKVIARSPVLATGMDGVRDSIIGAFGGTQQAAIDSIVDKVNAAAIVVIDFAIAGSEGARDFYKAWSLVKVIVLSLETGLMEMAAAAASAYAAIATGATYLPGHTQKTLDMAAAAKATAADLWLLANGLGAQADEAVKGVMGVSAFDASLDKLEGGLMNTRDRMIEASGTHTILAEATERTADATDHHTLSLKMTAAQMELYVGSAERLAAVGLTWADTLKNNISPGLEQDVEDMLRAGAAAKDLEVQWGILPPVMQAIQDKMKQQGPIIQAWETATEHLASVGKSFADTLKNTISPGLEQDVEDMLKAGASAKDLEVAWGILPTTMTAVQDKMKATAEASKLVADGALLSEKVWAEYFNGQTARYGTDVDKATAAAEMKYTVAVAEAQKKGITDVSYYDGLWALYQQDVDKSTQAAFAKDVTSRAHYQTIADAATKAYTQALNSDNQYTAAGIENLRKAASAAQDALSNWATLADAALKKTGNAADDATKKLQQTTDGLTSATKAAQQFTMGMTGDLSALAAQAGGMVSKDYYGNDYVYVPGKNAAPTGARAVGAFAGGVTNFAGGVALVGEKGPELVNLPGGSDVIPLTGRGGGGTTITNHFYVNGTAADVARQVADHIMRTVKQGTRI